MENSRNKQSLIFLIRAILSSVMEFHTNPLCPTRNMNHPFVQCIDTVHVVQ